MPNKAIRTGQRIGRAVPRTEKLPHERDESVGATGDVPSETVQQASRDLVRGLRDTDRELVMEETYRRRKRR